MKVRLLLLLLLTGMILHAQSLSVIGNNNGVPGALTFSTLQSVFKGETTNWGNNGPRIVLALMKSITAPGGLTCSKVYGTSCPEVTKYWLGKAMGTNSAPVFFNSVGELQAFVAGTPGAIGIIDLPSPVAGVHVIAIDGKNSF